MLRVTFECDYHPPTVNRSGAGAKKVVQDTGNYGGIGSLNFWGPVFELAREGERCREGNRKCEEIGCGGGGWWREGRGMREWQERKAGARQKLEK